MKIISFFLASILLVGTFIGYNLKPVDSPNKNIEISLEENIGFSEFDNEIIKFINKTNGEGNYMFSPLSFRYAMALATSGANGQTQEELLSAMGFKSMDEYLSWTKSINDITDRFDKYLAEDIEFLNKYSFQDVKPDRALKVANSIWHNSDSQGKIKEDYINYAKENFGAVAKDVPLNKLVDSVNNWVNENTNGLIPTLFSQNLPGDTNTILINTLYLKSSWLSTFNENLTKEDDFTTIDNKTVKKDFMSQEEKFLYYEDKESQLVILPMEGDVYMAVVLGDNNNILNKIKKASNQLVMIKMPKFEVETSFDKKELINYLESKDVDLALRNDGSADFSNMIEGAGINIGNIIQKTKIKVDEEGTEAAAVTAITMLENTAVKEPQKPKEFIANKPFTYYIYSYGDTSPELMFYGQMVK